MRYYFNSIMEITIPISILVSCMLLLIPVIKKSLVVKWRYAIWLFIGLRLIFPFKLNLFKPVQITLSERISMSDTAGNLGLDGAVNFGIGRCLFIIWFAGAAVYIIFNAVCYFKFRKGIKRWKTVPSENTMEVFCKFGLPRNRLIISKYVSIPMVFGIFRPVVILPHERYTPHELYIIFSHETTHYKNKDILYKLLLLFACAVHWFNPIVHIMAKTAARDIELNCDDEVVSNLSENYRMDYCRVILSVIKTGKRRITPCSTNFEVSKRILHERLACVLDMRNKRNGILLFTAAGICVILCGGIIEYTTAAAAEKVPIVPELIKEVTLMEKVTASMPEVKSTALPTTAVQEKKTRKQTEVPSEKETIKPQNKPTAEPTGRPAETAFVNEPDNKTANTDNERKENVSVSVDEQSYLLYPKIPDDKNEITYAYEFKGAENTSLSASMIKGDYGFQIINSKTGEVIADNSDGSKNNVTIQCKEGESYNIRVNSNGDNNNEGARLYVYGD